jgi:misacylated tRNA(Ala) deacylase
MTATPTHPYRADPYLTEAEAPVLAVEEGRVRLDRSLFYPAGGGQPGDAGRIEWDGGAAEVVDSVKGPDGTVELVLAEGAAAPAPGATVLQRLDADRRRAHMRVHTALHLLSVVIPLPVTGGAISAGKGRLDFDMEEPPEDKEALQAELQALIDADHPVTEEWITDAELEADPGLVKTMSVKPPTGQGHVRLVRIGAGETPVDLQPCGGTHVRATAEIGRVRLGKIEKKGRRNRRVTLHLEG